MRTAIIGTAGRDKTKPMTKELWQWMLEDAKSRVSSSEHLVSGGAAWADHLAVALFLEGKVEKLTLHLPAPFIKLRFKGVYGSSGNAANYYHQNFSSAIGENTLRQISDCFALEGCDFTVEPEAPGYKGMFSRNAKVATADTLFAYTFGQSDVPADGGTKHTWDKCKGIKYHVTLPTIR